MYAKPAQQLKDLGTVGDMRAYSSETVAFLWASVNA